MNGNIEFISNAMFILLWKALAGETQLVGRPPMQLVGRPPMRQRLLVPFQVKPHAQVMGSIPHRGHSGGS